MGNRVICGSIYILALVLTGCTTTPSMPMPDEAKSKFQQWDEATTKLSLALDKFNAGVEKKKAEYGRD